ncbi:MAG TPA: tetratricopeptide repeat protein, partial [Spirochaetia bacterium]|nr:tetratricopeptide repeat protein [Spirochaetia bacterium]
GLAAAALLVFGYPCFGENGHTSPSPESIYRSAVAAYRTLDYTRARDLFEKIVLENPRTSFVGDSLFYLAECELVLGDSRDAERHYRTVLSLYPDSSFREASAFRLADIAWRAKNASQALVQLDLLQQQFPEGSFAGSALLIAADIHLAQGDYALALAGYEEAIAGLKDGAGKQSALYSKGLTLLALGSAADAQESFAQAAAGTVVDIAEKAGFRSAVLLAGGGRQQEAEAALGAFLNRFPGSDRTEQAASLLASLLVKSGASEGALVWWNLLVKGFPGSDSLPEYFYRRGMALLSLDRFSAALDDFQAVVTRFPRSWWSAQSSYAIGYVYSQRAEYPRALQYFQAAARDLPGAAGQNPSGAERTYSPGELRERSLLSLGICLYNMGSFEKALAQLDELRRTSPKSISDDAIAVLSGRTLYRMGRLDEAVRRLDEAGKDGPSAGPAIKADAAYWLGWANLRLGRLEEARNAFLGLARGYPADPRCLESLLRAGICETMRADDPAGVRLFDEVVAAPRSVARDDVREQALFEEGRALDRLGRNQERDDIFERLAAEFPAGKLAPQAFFELAERAFSDGRYAAARSGFLRVARDFPGSGLGLQALYRNAEAALEEGDVRAALEGFWACLAQGARAGLLTTATDAFRAALRQTRDLTLARAFSDKAAGTPGLAVEASAGIRLE